MRRYLIKCHFFYLIIESVYYCNNIDKYELVKLISGIANGLNRTLVLCKFKDLGFESQIIFTICRVRKILTSSSESIVYTYTSSRYISIVRFIVDKTKVALI